MVLVSQNLRALSYCLLATINDLSSEKLIFEEPLLWGGYVQTAERV